MTAPSILLDLSDGEEADSLLAALGRVGLSAKALVGGGGLSEAVIQAGADFVLLDARAWEERSATLPQPSRSYLIVLLLDLEEEAKAPALLGSGAFDFILRDGEGWETRTALYFKALATLRRRLAGAMGALERRYEDLVHALPDIVYELDEEGRFTFINNSVRLLGWEPSELAGRHFSVLLHEEDAKAVDRDMVLGHFNGITTGPALAPKLFNERRRIDRRTEGLELRLRRHKASRDSPVEEDLIASVTSYGEVSAVGEYADGEPDFLGSVGVIRDITLRRKSEDMLRKLYRAVDQLTAGVIVTDRGFGIEYVNPAFLRLTAKGPQDLLGRNLFSLFRIETELAEEMVSLVVGGFEARKEVLLDLGESSVWVALHASPVSSPSGDVTHASVICEDISGRRAMEELLGLAKDEAERANRAKSDFLAAMSHELKSPVAAILAAARLIEMGDGEPSKRAASIIGSAQGLLSLLGDILDFVRFESGSNSLRKFVFPLGGFMARTLEAYRAAARAKGLSFEVGKLPEGSLYSDPDRLGRALGALLDNAVYFTDTGWVRVEASLERREGNLPWLLLSVSDSGRGIAPEDQGRIFSPFVQVETGLARRGAGIGLSLARNIVRALGGEIRLESGLGRGSVFTILLPSGEAEELRRGAARPVLGARVYRLLVVDDNEVNLEYMAAILGTAGHKVDLASSGAEALRLAEEHSPDAAILDIQMPGMSGIELERRLRASTAGRWDPRLPVIALTAFDSQDVLDSGADFAAIFAKPFDAKLLAAALDRGIDASEAAWFSLGASHPSLLERAAKEVPGLLSALAARAASEPPAASDGEVFRTEAQVLAGRLDALGASSAASALRRLALAINWEDRGVIASRLERFAAAWRLAAGPEAGPPP